MKKKILVLVLALCMLTCTAFAQENSYTPGTYTASEAGMGGDVTMEMTFDAAAITAVKITGDKETPGIGDKAIEQLTAAIMQAQSAEVDSVAGATITSTAIKTAAAACIDQAKGAAQAKAEFAAEQTADVIVIGGGAAGLSAAVSAAENGASVILLEANGVLGGATIRSGGHILVFDEATNAAMDRNDDALAKYLEYDPADFGDFGEALTTAQSQITEYLKGETAGRFDSPELALVDHYLKGNGTDLDGNKAAMDYALLKESFVNASSLNAWLIENGMGIQQAMFTTHSGTPVDGPSGLVNALKNSAEAKGAQIILNMRATELIVENNAVVGVVAQDNEGKTYTYHANKGVVIASGGYQANSEMVVKYQNVGKGLSANNASTSPDTNRGDGMVMAEAIGAQLRDMGFICTVIQGYHGGASMGEFGKVNGTQQLIVNANGERFMDDVKANGMSTGVGIYNDQPDGLGYFIGDAKMLDAINAKQDGLAQDLAGRGDWFVIADTLEEAIEKSGLDVEKTLKTIENFNGYVDAGADPDFGRTAFNGKVESNNGPYIVAKFESHIHLTFGGLVINRNAQVLDTNNEPIANLYASGDVVSGFEGSAHQTGDCLTFIIYYGKVAGEQAAASL